MQTLGFGILLSVGIEFSQLFIPGRSTQGIDVMTNATGAWLGAIIFVFLTKRLQENRMARVLAFELPLMNLVYFLIPLMWLNALSMGEEISRLWLILLLGLIGGYVISSIYLYRFKDEGAFGSIKLFCLIMGWFLIGAIPKLTNYPMRIIIFGAIIGVIPQIFARLQQKRNKDKKRFELSTLKRLLPLCIIYILLLVVWPTTIPLNEWLMKVKIFDERILFTFRFIEFIAAFTLFGYMIAELRGRKNESLAQTLGWILCITLIGSTVFFIIKGYPQLVPSDVLQIIIFTVTSLYGGIIYRLQLSAIQSL